LFFFVRHINAQDHFVKNSLTVPLGETYVKINIYERSGSNITFFSPHHNEQIALKLARTAVLERGGRLVEVESFDENGDPIRRLNFNVDGRSHSIDPNRIFTANGRNCSGLTDKAGLAIKNFAEQLLNIIFQPSAGLPQNERMLVAVHNNSDSSEKPTGRNAADLTAISFAGEINSSQPKRTEFQDQAAGVYLSNTETDTDNFVFLSTPQYIGYFANKGFNVVVQKPLGQSDDKRCSVDDGSLSVYSAQKEILYICLEADAKNGAVRQKQMLDAIYDLADGSFDSTSIASGGFRNGRVRNK